MSDMSLRAYGARWAREFDLNTEQMYGRLRALVDQSELESGGVKGSGKSKPFTPRNWIMLVLAMMSSDTKVGAGERAPEIARLPDVTATLPPGTGAPGTNRYPGSADLRARVVGDGEHTQLETALVTIITTPALIGVVTELEVSRWRPQAWLRLHDRHAGTSAEMVFATRPAVDVVADNTVRLSGWAFDRFIEDVEDIKSG